MDYELRNYGNLKHLHIAMHVLRGKYYPTFWQGRDAMELAQWIS